nr:PREDICTED: cysteine-rich with EGF-like domain protein 2 isoform X2 [Latimeria chalumnae]|eukprot:XP_014350874.1 PREDICTED: cysteine-rich with EGF-like domain protein 2 isoform X2 [Latimeria chalumnae]
MYKGLEDTAKKNFGGGNTAWEERKLSKYESSEIRLVEIIESLCDSSNFECNNMVEAHEEHIENWWFKKKKNNPDLLKWFCIETIEVCCPSGTYGSDCLACRGGSERPCHGNGDCDGDGTRGGNGSCHCNAEYKGDFCMECADGYYSTFKNDTHAICTACHDACKTCTGPSNKDCKECKSGWVQDDENVCQDVDECAAEVSPCQDNQYCLNTEGSYSCKVCDDACSDCIGEGPDNCTNCTSGYTMTDKKCTDIDECSLLEKVCLRVNEECVNTVGSYKCVCSEGFEDTDNGCVQVEEKEETDEENPSTSEIESLAAVHEDL